MQTPKVFISHSSKDKGSVRILAERLRKDSIDALYAEWEIRPGDSIVQRIDQGLSECDVFVVVVSENSVASRWVREELSSAVVRRISGEAKIIPVRLDDTPVPTVINHLHWVKIPPPEEEYNKLVKAVFGVSDKPPLGTTPEFVNRGLERRQGTISGFSPEASAILRHLVLKADLFEPISAAKLTEELSLNETEIGDDLEELEGKELISTIGVASLNIIPKASAWLYVEIDHLDD